MTPTVRPAMPAGVGRASVTTCATCGDPVFFARYVPAPELMRPGKRRRVLLDAIPSVAGDPLASFAVDGDLGGRCRRLAEDDPLDVPLERPHAHHFATHPACKPTHSSRES